MTGGVDSCQCPPNPIDGITDNEHENDSEQKILEHQPQDLHRILVRVVIEKVFSCYEFIIVKPLGELGFCLLTHIV